MSSFRIKVRYIDPDRDRANGLRFLDPVGGTLHDSPVVAATAIDVKYTADQIRAGVWTMPGGLWDVRAVDMCACGQQAAEMCSGAYPLCTKMDPQPRMTATEVLNGQAFKADDGKLRWGLLLNNTLGVGKAVRAVVRVLNFAVRSKDKGGKGYTPHSWREVPNAKERYEDALHRHLDALREGETHDAESGESHWAHVATNALFLHELHEVK